jgi:hypothetical protein
VSVEDPGDPLIERRDDLRLLNVDRPRMLDPRGERVLAGVAATVIGLLVVPASLHTLVAQSASKEAAEQVGVRRPARLADRGAAVGGSPCSRGLEHLLADQRLMGDTWGAHPFVLVVPAQPGPVASRDVLHVDQDLVAALTTQTAIPVYRGLIRIARTAVLLQPRPFRCELRSRS